MKRRMCAAAGLAWGVLLAAGCRTIPAHPSVAGRGDEIIVAGQRIHTGTPVVTWLDPGGYDAYQTGALVAAGAPEPAGARAHPAGPKRYGPRPFPSADAAPAAWDLPRLQQVVDQLVLHYDTCGLSKICFDVLQNRRGLSVHFLLDVDGTIYQTLDLQERAAHATLANDRSVGVEIANVGAYPPTEAGVLRRWYRYDLLGRPRLRIPAGIAETGIATQAFTGRPAQPRLVHGVVQGRELVQFDFTPQQYAALIKLTAALCTVFPRLTCDCPRDATGRVVLQKLPDDTLANFHGILGHFHIQANKIDPGPALQWDRLIDGARAVAGRNP
jgi:N-acetyl-anhydromuramyl-L-alanine amidase AmpD